MILEELKAAQPGQTIYDRGEKSSVKGLHLRVKKDGKKSFLLYYRNRGGQERRPKLGEFGEITLAQARERARAILDQVSLGEDPSGQWELLKDEPTVLETFELALRHYWGTERFERSGRRHEVEMLFKNHLKYRFGGQKLSQVKIAEIRLWHGALEKTPYVANRALEVLSKVFRYAEEMELRPPGSNPCRLVPAFTEKKRSRFASVEELKKLHTILEREAEKRPRAVAMIYLLLYSGSRPQFLRRATWNQLTKVSVGRETYGVLKLTGKTTEKTGDEEQVILPPQAMRILERLPKAKDRNILGIHWCHKFWEQIREEAGFPDLRLRDLRRTFATVGMSNGVTQGTIGELLNHKSIQTTKIYAKLWQEVRIEAAGTIANRLENIIRGKPARAKIKHAAAKTKEARAR